MFKYCRCLACSNGLILSLLKEYCRTLTHFPIIFNGKCSCIMSIESCWVAFVIYVAQSGSCGGLFIVVATKSMRVDLGKSQASHCPTFGSLTFLLAIWARAQEGRGKNKSQGRYAFCDDIRSGAYSPINCLCRGPYGRTVF